MHGPIFSIITPFKSNGEIDYKSLNDYLIYLHFRGARNFYIMFYNSRLGLLSEKEIIELNIFCIKVVKNLNKNNIIICAEPYHCSTKKSIEYVNKFYKEGADIVSLIFGEKYYNEDQIFSHFNQIHKNTNIPLLLHQQILENGSSDSEYKLYPLKVLKRIGKLKKFIAMKEDAKNDLYTKKICKNLSKDIVIITSGGGNKQWVEAAKYGAQSWLSGISLLDPLIDINFYKFYKENDKKSYLKIIKFLEEPFFKVKEKFGWHLTIKGFIQFFGHFNRYERKPLISLNYNQYNHLKPYGKKILNFSQLYFNGDYFDKIKND